MDTTSSFNNTPQAVDDSFSSSQTGLTEDVLKIVYLDVMKDDLGGKAKVLFSLDDGIVESTGSTGATDLLIQDTARVEALSNDTSLNGAKIWITSDGKVGYDAGTLNTGFKAQLQALQTGEYLDDTFVYAIRLANGTLSWATVSVQFAGANDAPVLDLDANDSSGVTGTGYQASFTENGSAVAIVDFDMAATDIDNTTLQSATITLTNAQANDSLAISGLLATGIDATINTSVAGQISVTLTGSASLAEYQTAIKQVVFSNSSEDPSTLDRIITVVVGDDNLTSNSATSIIHVTAMNDAAVIAGTATGTVVEAGGVANGAAGTASASGSLTAADVDDPADTFQAVAAGTASDQGYGSYEMTAAGVWTYTLDNTNPAVEALNAGGQLGDSFTVLSADGTAQVVTITIEGSNDAAVIALDGMLAYGENQAATAISTALTVSDLDSATLIGATVSISGNFVPGEDVLGFADQNGISSSYDNGVLTLSGTASLADYEAALRSVTYFNGSDDPSGATRTIGFQVDDGTAADNLSNVATATVTVIPVNDAPTLSATALNPTFEEASGLGAQAAAVAVFSSANVGTVEAGQTVIGLTITVGGLLDGANERISIDGTAIALGGASSGTTATNGMSYAVTIAGGTATVALSQLGGVPGPAIEVLVNGITYQNTSIDNPTAGTRTVTLTQIKDSGGTASSGSDTTAPLIASAVTVTPVNDPPTISNFGATSTSISFVVADPDNSTLSLASPFAAAFGNPSISNGSNLLNPTEQETAGSAMLQVTDGSASTDVIVLYLGSGNNDLVINGGDSVHAVYGFAGNDSLTGGNVGDWIFGGGGNDTIDGAQNDAILDGGADTDTLRISANFNSASNAQIVNFENILLTAAVSLNLSNQTEGSNVLGSPGNDSIIGGSGGDRIQGAQGNDALTGNGDADQFRLQTDGGTDTVNDFAAGTDKIGFLEGTGTGAVNFVTSGTQAGATPGGNDFVVRASISNINPNDDNRVVVISAQQSTTQITTNTAGSGGNPTANIYVVVFNSTTGKAEIWFDDTWHTTAGRIQVAALDGVTAAQVAALTSADFVLYGNTLAPAGIAGSTINLALGTPPGSGAVTYTISGVPADWSLNQGINDGDGRWTVETDDPTSLYVTTATSFAGALLLDVDMTWTNHDGSIGTASVANNVEAYATSPIFAIAGDDTLTGSAGDDTFVFAQPIGAGRIYQFDTVRDTINLIGFGVGGYADLAIADDDCGNAVVTLASDMTITLVGVGAVNLSAGNFAFDAEPASSNHGLMTIGNGAILPLGGTVENTGTISLGSADLGSTLQILSRGASFSGGGQIVLSDNMWNVVIGGDAGAVFTNIDNRMSGAGQLGYGRLTVVNEAGGVIEATGSSALVIDTGANAVVNTGTLHATGSGGLVVESMLTGGGAAVISDGSRIEFAAACDAAVTFALDAAGMLTLDESGAFTGTLTGFGFDDLIDLADISFGGATLGYAANADGSGGVLTVSDGATSANLALLGQYDAAGFAIGADANGGTRLTYVATTQA